MHRILFLCFLLFSSVSSATAQQKVNAVLGLLDIPTGQDKAATTMVIQTAYKRAMLEKIRSVNEPLRKAELRAEEQRDLRKLGAGFTDTTEHKGIYRLSPIAGFVAVGPGSSVLEETTQNIKRWHMFYNDKLYGVALSINDSRTFVDQVANFNQAFGKPDSTSRPKGSDEVRGVTWNQDKAIYILRNFKTEFGIVLLVKLAPKAWEEVQKVTRQNLSAGPKDKESADKLLEDILK